MTGDVTVGPDPIVETALQLLPVPDHGPSFWADLEHRLAVTPRGPAQEPSPVEPALAVGPPVAADRRTDATHHPRPARARRARAPRSAPAAPVTSVVPPTLRRGSNAVLAIVAVVAAIVVLMAGATLVRQRTQGASGTTAAAKASRPATTATTARDRAADGTPERTVLTWVRALATGDDAAAWADLGPASQAHFGSRSAFEQQRAALAARYGVWAQGTPEQIIVTPVPAGGEAMLVVVTFAGTVRDGGANVRRAEAIPVRLADGTAVVEPFAFAGELELTVPAPAGRAGGLPLVHPDDALVISVPRGVAAPTVRIDAADAVVCGGETSTSLTEPADAPGQRCTYRPTGGLKPGRRVLTVAFASADGSTVSARSVLFEVA